LLNEMAYLRVGQALNTRSEVIHAATGDEAHFAFEKDFDRLARKYQEKGYAAAPELGNAASKVAFLTPDHDGVKVTLTMVEIRVGKISFDWGKAKPRTSERVFRSYMKTKEGSFYNFNQIQDDMREIFRLDILDDIRVKNPDQLKFDRNDPSKVILVFEVKEKRTGNVSAGGGLSSRYGLVGFANISQSNLWGLAQRIGARLEVGGRFSADVDYFYPLLDGRGTEVTAHVFDTTDKTGANGLGVFSSARSNFNQDRRGAETSISRPIWETVRLSLGYRFENVSTTRRGALLPELPPFPFQDLGSDSTSSVTLRLTHDTRDQPFDATRGTYQEGSLEFAGLGGDNSFLKYRAEARNYIPLFGGTVPSGRREPRPAWVGALRYLVEWSSGTVPFSQSYFIGGADTLRGYSEDRFFGNRGVLLNAELRRAFKGNIQLVGFFDAGRAWQQVEAIQVPKGIASAIGAGIRVTTPLGPIRLDYGFGGEGSRLHFSFGQTF
jgi:outer membrane protein insertion porin family